MTNHLVDHTPLVLAGMEVHLFGLHTHPGAPVVFLTHGRGGQAEDLFPWAVELSGLGLVTVVVEQRNHGKRTVDAAQNGVYDAAFPTNLYANMLGTAADVSLLIDLLPARCGLAMDRVGMTGASMGGHVTLLAMAADPRIAVGAAMIGSGDFLTTQRERAVQHQVTNEALAHYLPPALVALAERVDPIACAARFADRPLLLTNGEADTLVPILGNERFVAACAPFYARLERCHLSRYPGVGHEVPPAMWNEVKGWLTRWLIAS